MFSLRPKVIGKFQSDYSGTIRIIQGWGFRHLSTEKIQQSGGIVREIWSRSLKNKVEKHRRWLVLGVAGGSVLTLISGKYAPDRIVGVDIDPVIVEAGRKFFGLDRLPRTQIIITDAKKFVKTTQEKFDYILVDIFGVEGPPAFVYTPEFLRQVKQLGSRVFINHLYNTPDHIQSAQQLLETLTALGYTPQLQKILANAVIIC